jgi:D-alanyl-D-alanine carboxypeptidase/D-alanyl-D-alanine-endopeptidase (penicillin-binding protein 4)
VIYLEGGLSFDSLKKETSVISVAVDNPTLFFLNLFKDRIVKSKIKFRGALLDIDDLNDKLYYYKYRLVSQVYSPELKLIVNDVNKNSNNLSSEILLKAIGKESVGIGSTKEGIKQVQKYLKRMGISSDNIVYVDGSGLSRQNLISPLNLVRLFSEIQKMPYKDLFLNSMAQPNKDGTLKRRMTKSLAENSLYAKTGSMENVSTIAGIVKAKDKPPIGLAILINNFTVPLNLVRNIQDLICMRISAFSTNP